MAASLASLEWASAAELFDAMEAHGLPRSSEVYAAAIVALGKLGCDHDTPILRTAHTCSVPAQAHF